MDHDELVNKRVHAIGPELGKRNRAIADAHAESLRAIATPLAGQTARAIATTNRGIPAPRGDQWQSPQIMRQRAASSPPSRPARTSLLGRDDFARSPRERNLSCRAFSFCLFAPAIGLKSQANLFDRDHDLLLRTFFEVVTEVRPGSWEQCRAFSFASKSERFF
jgi:hypothetical protein